MNSIFIIFCLWGVEKIVKQADRVRATHKVIKLFK